MKHSFFLAYILLLIVYSALPVVLVFSALYFFIYFIPPMSTEMLAASLGGGAGWSLSLSELAQLPPGTRMLYRRGVPRLARRGSSVLFCGLPVEGEASPKVEMVGT